jgi:hypothetical protein
MTRSAARRSTTNKNVTGNSRDRARRRAFLVATYGWPEVRIVLCWLCHVPLLQDDDPDAPGQSVTVDRVIPGCEGGRYVPENIRPACGPCNMSTGGQLGAARRLSAVSA